LNNPDTMDIVYVLILVAAALLFYQLVIYKDPDKLDSKGHAVNKRKKQRIF